MKLTIIIVSLILIAIAIICTLKIESFYNFLTYSVYFFDVVACIIGSITICYALKKVVFENYAWILLILGWIRFNTIVFGSPRTPSIRRQVNGDTAMIQ